MFYILLPIVAVAGFLAYASTKPNMMKYHREALIAAPPEKIFALLENLHQWRRWSPWDKKDQNIKRTYSGPEGGPGAVYEWNGNNDVGQGRMEILSTTPNSHVNIQLDFIKPFEGHNSTEFRLTPQEGGTLVSWTMTGPANLMSKVMGTFMDMDKMIGKDFEQGLENIKLEVQG